MSRRPWVIVIAGSHAEFRAWQAENPGRHGVYALDVRTLAALAPIARVVTWGTWWRRPDAGVLMREAHRRGLLPGRPDRASQPVSRP